MVVKRSTNIANPVILMKKVSKDFFVVVDSNTTVRFLNLETLKLKNGFKVNVKHEHYKTSVIDFSKNGQYFTFLTATRRESLLYSTKTKKMITKVERHQGEVSCVKIDPLCRYMFSCGDDGKTFAIDLKSGKIIFTLPHHSDTINDIAFSANADWVATASYDRKISLFNLDTMTPKNRLKAHSAPVMHLALFDENKLLSIDKKSSAIVWNIYNGKVLYRLQGIHDDVTALAIHETKQLLFLATALGYVIVFDLSSKEMVTYSYIKLNGSILRLLLDEERNYLYVGTESGVVEQYELFEGVEQFQSFVQKRRFDLAQELIESNPLLIYTKAYHDFDEIWEANLNKAKILLQKGEREKATLVLGQFKSMPPKNKIMQKVLREYVDFPKFAQLAREGKLALAYGLANKHPAYKESNIYKSLEARWKKAFSQAQKYMLDPKSASLAKEILAPYRGISEKTKFIQEILSQVDVYKRFRAAIGKKDFQICSDLIKQYRFLTELPEYTSLMNYADSLYMKSQKFMDEGDIHSAIKILRVLQDFDEFKDEARNFMIDLESKAKFFKAIHDDDIQTAYNMMDISQDLILTPDGIKLHDMWNSDWDKANSYALLGDIAGVKSTLEKYMTIDSKYVALATIFSFTYMVQLEDALQNNLSRQEIENGIKNYLLNFGLSEQIEAFFNLFKDVYPESKLNLELLQKGSLSMWRPSMIVESILD